MRWGNASHDEIEEGLSHFLGLSSAALGHVCDLISAADNGQIHLVDGAADLAQWLSARFGLSPRTGRRLVDVARRLETLPRIRELMHEGEFSFDQVESLSKMATLETESELIDMARGLSTSALDRAARRANPPSVDDEMSAWESRSVHIQRSLDGFQGRMTAHLNGGALDIVETAVRQRADRIPPNPETGVFDPYPQRMADGLVEVCATSGDQASMPPQVTVHTDLDALITTDSGTVETQNGSLLSNETARRLACDAVVETVVHGQSGPLGVGRRSRTIPGWLRRQLYHRDGGCRFPGCGRTAWTHGHHITHWADGGLTDLENLITLCGHHHRFVHEHNWSMVGHPDGRVLFLKPDGSKYPPPRPQLHPRLMAVVSI